MVIAGAGPTEKELRKQTARQSIENVHFLGFVSDETRAALLETCVGVVFPSHLRSEAFGVALIEGALYGKPLISTELGTGTSHVNIDQKTGIVVPPGNVPALTGAMSFLFQNPDAALKMGIQARLRYEQFFSGKIIANKYVELYQMLAINNQVSN